MTAELDVIIKKSGHIYSFYITQTTEKDDKFIPIKRVLHQEIQPTAVIVNQTLLTFIFGRDLSYNLAKITSVVIYFNQVQTLIISQTPGREYVGLHEDR